LNRLITVEILQPSKNTDVCKLDFTQISQTQNLTHFWFAKRTITIPLTQTQFTHKQTSMR